MMGVGLFPGDIAVVDRSRTPIEGSIVLALLSGEFTIKRYRKRARGFGCRPRTQLSATSS
jgi:DNA polymerase V